MSSCATSFIEHTRHLFVDVAQRGAIASGRRPARRAVFRKLHGIACARMVIDAGAPPELRQGVFAGDGYDAWIRFSSDVAPDGSDAENGTVGIAIKLFGISGPTLAAIDPDAPTGDLLLQNHNVFFVDTGRDMCEFTDLALKGRIDDWFATHPDTKLILDDMQKREESVLTATYWSVLPYACGAGVAVKYRLKPLVQGQSLAPADDPNRLRSDFAARLAVGDAEFRFEVQLPRMVGSLPLDQATRPWPEDQAPFLTVGRLKIPKQDVNVEGQEPYGEALAFSPWRVPEANRPLGSIAESRRAAYPSSAALRHYVNGTPEAEPHAPRPPAAL